MVGALLDTTDEEPRLIILLNDLGRGTCEEATLDLGAASELLGWLAQALREPRALSKGKEG
jgi:hypothetical protein